MRDFLLTEALKRLATDAATHFSSRVASGDQIPFDVGEQEGPDSLFHIYEPLTSRYVREREDELRMLPSFGSAREAVNVAGAAASYLETRGEVVPPEPDERAAKMLTVFIASLWDGCTEFSLNRERLERALAVLDAEARDINDAEVLIAPIVGLRMSLSRLDLPSGMRVVRADTVEAPIEAMRCDGMGRAAWEPQYLAVAEQSDGPEGAEAALCQLSELISVMRLFKGGGIGLGPYAFAPTGEGQWRRLATGASATRPGGYRLNEDEAAELAELASALEARPDPDGALAWAVGRFEMGCERETAMEGLTDHLMSLRAVLEGKGPVGASLPMRAAALIAGDSDDRIEIRERVEHALELERSLMNGVAAKQGPELAAWVEESLRRMLREAALGKLSKDMSAAADETLIATGLAEGDLEIAVTVPTASPNMREGEDMDGIDETQRSSPDRSLALSGPDEGQADRLKSPIDRADYLHSPPQEDDMEDTRILEPIPDEDEITITATNWLDEVSVDDRTLDFPAIEGDVGDRERIDTPRVRHLFPVPEDAEWEVRELKYDHYDHDRRAG